MKVQRQFWMTFLAFSCMLMGMMTSNAMAQISANGQNVKWISYSQQQGGSIAGKFYQNSNGQWIEEAPDGRHTLTELQRDAWSVYLKKSDGARVQLDLHTKDITLNGSQKLYKIAAAQTSVPRAGSRTSQGHERKMDRIHSNQWWCGNWNLLRDRPREMGGG